MPFEPVTRRSLPDEVYDQLLGRILGGEFAAGDTLPSERALAEALGVSRPALREALKRLEQAGLLEIRQGDATTVRDVRASASLDLLPRLLLRSASGIDGGVARSIMELRGVVGPDAARRCAQRRSPALAVALLEAVDALEATVASGDVVQAQHRALDVWDRIVDGADNIAYRLLYNGLRQTYTSLLEVLTHVLADEVGDVAGHRAIADAVVAQDADAADAAARALLARGQRAVSALLDSLEVSS